MNLTLLNEIERLKALIDVTKRGGPTDFNSGTYDLLSTLEDQSILVSRLASKETLSKFETRLIKRLILEAQFLIL